MQVQERRRIDRIETLFDYAFEAKEQPLLLEGDCFFVYNLEALKDSRYKGTRHGGLYTRAVHDFTRLGTQMGRLRGYTGPFYIPPGITNMLRGTCELLSEKARSEIEWEALSLWEKTGSFLANESSSGKIKDLRRKAWLQRPHLRKTLNEHFDQALGVETNRYMRERTDFIIRTAVALAGLEQAEPVKIISMGTSIRSWFEHIYALPEYDNLPLPQERITVASTRDDGTIESKTF